MTSKQHRAAVELIDKFFNRLAYTCQSSRHWDKYLDIIRKEERGHRWFRPDGVQCGLTTSKAVKQFAVKCVFDQIVGQDPTGNIFTPGAADFFTVRHSVFAAVAILGECETLIKKEFTKAEMLLFRDSVDYAKLNEDPSTWEA